MISETLYLSSICGLRQRVNQDRVSCVETWRPSDETVPRGNGYELPASCGIRDHETGRRRHGLRLPEQLARFHVKRINIAIVSYENEAAGGGERGSRITYALLVFPENFPRGVHRDEGAAASVAQRIRPHNLLHSA